MAYCTIILTADEHVHVHAVVDELRQAELPEDRSELRALGRLQVWRRRRLLPLLGRVDNNSSNSQIANYEFYKAQFANNSNWTSWSKSPDFCPKLSYDAAQKSIWKVGPYEPVHDRQVSALFLHVLFVHEFSDHFIITKKVSFGQIFGKFKPKIAYSEITTTRGPNSRVRVEGQLATLEFWPIRVSSLLLGQGLKFSRWLDPGGYVRHQKSISGSTLSLLLLWTKKIISSGLYGILNFVSSGGQNLLPLFIQLAATDFCQFFMTFLGPLWNYLSCLLLPRLDQWPNLIIGYLLGYANVLGHNLRELPDRMIRKMFGFFDPLPTLSAFGSDLYYKIHATSAFPLHPPPSNADIISGSSLILQLPT